MFTVLAYRQFITKADGGKIIFFEDGSEKVDDDGNGKATYKISEVGAQYLVTYTKYCIPLKFTSK